MALTDLPDVITSQTNGNLGLTAPSEDGITLMIVCGAAVSGQFALGDLLGPFRSLADAEALGIDQAYDAANGELAWKHISDFYTEAGNGTELYVQVVDIATTMDDMVTVSSNLPACLLQLQGRVRLVVITGTTDTQPYADQFPEDLWDAIVACKALRASEYDEHRPIQFFLEGRDWQGNASSSLDCRLVGGLESNRTSIVISQDLDYATNNGYAAKYAEVAKAAGRAAKVHVGRNIGRVKDGPVSTVNAAFSNGVAFALLGDTNVRTLNAYGYIFLRKVGTKAGFYWNHDHTTAPITDDYGFVRRGRVMDKADRIAYSVYLEELLDDVELEPSGKLPTAVIKSYQGSVEKEIKKQMVSTKEIVSVTAFCDPNQNVLGTDEIRTELNLVGKANVGTIRATLSYANPAA